MSKNEPLTHEEFAAFRANEQVLALLGAYARRVDRPPSQIRVLDWGCGRGRMVLSLRKRGFQAYGVDPDSSALSNGVALMTALGFSPEALAPLRDGAHSRFPTQYFDFVFSNQVLEHVQNLPAVVSEIARITKPGGAGLHIFPPRWHVREAHLRMPFVHWLPKNGARRALIHLFAAFGVESRWDEMESTPLNERVDTYYRYSVDKTFYRSNSAIARIFHAHGMRTEFCTVGNPKLDRFALARGARRNVFTRGLMNAGLCTFVSAELSTRMCQISDTAEGN